MLNTITLVMVDTMIDHYRRRLDQAAGIHEKLFVAESLRYYSGIREKSRPLKKVFLQLNQCSCQQPTSSLAQYLQSA